MGKKLPKKDSSGRFWNKCDQCGYEERSEQFISWSTEPSLWPEPTPTMCPGCKVVGISYSGGIGDRRSSSNPYAGENAGLGMYIRSKSHFDEVVKERGLVEMGSERVPLHSPNLKRYE